MKQAIVLIISWIVSQVGVTLSFYAHAQTDLPASVAKLSAAEYDTRTLLEGLRSPWSLHVDKEGVYWVTEKQGALVIFDPVSQDLQRLNKPLPAVYAAGQGGLLDLVLLPREGKQQSILVSYAKGSANRNALTVAQVDLHYDNGQWQVSKQRQIFHVQPWKSSPVHYAGRMLVLPDNTLLLNSGDGFDWREDAQKPTSLLGKTLRMTLTGAVPKDNPFANSKHPLTRYIYTLGHRNAQGLALDPQGRIWQHEHGPAGGDEINLLIPGQNYGWPVITYGKDYSGAQISPFTHYPEMQQPLLHWTPSIAPSALVYQGDSDQYPELAHSLLIPSLKYRRLHQLKILEEDQASLQFDDIIINMALDVRIRDITHTLDGDILLLTDGENAKIVQLLPAK